MTNGRANNRGTDDEKINMGELLMDELLMEEPTCGAVRDGNY